MTPESGRRSGRAFIWLALAIAGCVTGIENAEASAAALEPHAALTPLVGEWNVGPAGATTAFVERFSWGPARAYIWSSVAVLDPSGGEHPHFEGMIIWNAASRRFDYLFAVEPGSLTQEQGEFHVEENGTIVRDVRLTGADGTVSQFIQTFRLLDDGRIETSLMRKTDTGWTPTFPGSDRLTMVRRTD